MEDSSIEIPAVNTIHKGCEDQFGARAAQPLLFHKDQSAKPVAAQIGFDYFTRVLLRLLGSEVEGREIQLGVIVGPKPAGALGLVITEPDAGLTDAEQERMNDPDTAVKVYRDKLVGRADGTIGQDCLLVDPIDGRVHGLVSPAAPVEGKDTHSRYLNITRDSRYVAVWLKPARSARVYRYGELQEQVILLRDGLGWSIRKLSEISHNLETLIQNRIGIKPKQGLTDFVVRIAAELLESRLGASVFFVRNVKTFDAMVKTGSDREGDRSNDLDRELAWQGRDSKLQAGAG
jgi:hypothetical protein